MDALLTHFFCDRVSVQTRFKGVSQAAIAWVVGLHNLLYEDCEICWPKAPVLEMLSEYGEPFKLKAQGLPARLLNQAESVVDGVLTKDMHIVHLKGPVISSRVSQR